MNQLYTNEVPGNQGTKPVKVVSLTTEQRCRRASHQLYIRQIRTLSKELASVEAKQKALSAECNHHMFIDERIGGPAGEVSRTCALCGYDMGMI